MIGAVLSDLDGVLVDSHRSIMRAWRWWGEARRVAGDADAWVEHGRPSAPVIAAVAPHLDADAEAALPERRQAADVRGVLALPGAADLLGPGGPRPLAVVTSGTVPLATARLRAAGLPVPAVLVTPERLRAGKPDPEGYLLAARDLGVEPSACVVLEDAPAGVAAGRAAGMHVVGIATSTAPGALGAHEHAPTVAAWLRRAWPRESRR